MAASLRSMVSELVVYDADDSSCSNEAAGFVASHAYGAWTVDAKGIHAAPELNGVLDGFVNIKQLSFCTHGFPAGVYFNGGSLTGVNLSTVTVPRNLFAGPGRLLFMGCETARTKAGEDFLIAAGKHFFAGKGGIVGGATIYILGADLFTPFSDARLPVLGRSSGGWGSGKLILFHLDTKGNVIASKTVKPFGL